MPNGYLNPNNIAAYLAKANVPFRYLGKVTGFSLVPGDLISRIDVDVIEWDGRREKATVKIDRNGRMMCWYRGTLRGINFNIGTEE